MILFEQDRTRIATLGRSANSALRIHHQLQRRPLCTIPWLASTTKLSMPTVGKAVQALVTLNVVREMTGRRRDRVFAYTRYLELLNQGMEGL